MTTTYSTTAGDSQNVTLDRAPMQPTPDTEVALQAHLIAALPEGHAKLPLDSQTQYPSWAKLISLHAQMHGSTNHPMGHGHPITSETSKGRPPRDNLVRALRPGYELRASTDGGMPTLFGHFARFNEWNEIDSVFEGRFMERVAPGAFTKTFAENASNIKVTFNHGRDPNLGDKVLGPIAVLREEDVGPYYEIPLLDTSYNRDLVPGLDAGLYGSSYRFRVTREDYVKAPERSETNPEAIPERTIKEADVAEFGPVTFPADAGATASVRSLTDEFIFGTLMQGDALRKFAEFVRSETQSDAGDDPTSDTTASDAGGNPTSEPVKVPVRVRDYLKEGTEERPSWML